MENASNNNNTAKVPEKLLEMSLDEIIEMNNNKKPKRNFINNKNNYKPRGQIANFSYRGRNNFNRNFQPLIRKKKFNKYDTIQSVINVPNKINNNKNLENNLSKKFSKKLHITNLCKNVTKEELNKLFEIQGGKIKESNIILDENGNNTGEAFVEFEEIKDAIKAQNYLDKAEIEKVLMKVEFFFENNS